VHDKEGYFIDKYLLVAFSMCKSQSLVVHNVSHSVNGHFTECFDPWSSHTAHRNSTAHTAAFL
jgi:hypothetical protein